MYKRKYGAAASPSYDVSDTLGATADVGAPAAGTNTQGGANTGMNTMDWVGLGMQVAGAIANQKEQDQAKALNQTRYNQALQLGNRSRADQLQQNATENIARTRTQNMGGLNYMTNLVDTNENQARNPGIKAASFRQTMLYGG